MPASESSKKLESLSYLINDSEDRLNRPAKGMALDNRACYGLEYPRDNDGARENIIRIIELLQQVKLFPEDIKFDAEQLRSMKKIDDVFIGNIEIRSDESGGIRFYMRPLDGLNDADIAIRIQEAQDHLMGRVEESAPYERAVTKIKHENREILDTWAEDIKLATADKIIAYLVEKIRKITLDSTPTFIESDVVSSYETETAARSGIHGEHGAGSDAMQQQKSEVTVTFTRPSNEVWETAKRSLQWDLTQVLGNNFSINDDIKGSTPKVKITLSGDLRALVSNISYASARSQ